MKTITRAIFTATLLTVGCCLMTGCLNSDYRMSSTINTQKPYAMMWKEKPAWYSLTQIWDSDATTPSINPYTYNPANPNNYSKPTVNVQHSGKGPKTVIITDGAIADNSSWVESYNEWLKSKSKGDKHPEKNLPSEFFLINAPLYWKATLSSNITGFSDSERQYFRNDLQNAMFNVVKEATAKHLSSIEAYNNRMNLALGAATLGLAGGSSIASAGTSQALAAAAAGTTGARSLVNEQVYQNTIVPAFIALLKKDQADFAELIRTNYQTKLIQDYTVEAAIADAKEYENRGSFYNGQALLQQAVQNQINGGKNIVPINQLAPPIAEIISPDSLDITGGTNLVTATFTIEGQHLNLVDASKAFGLVNEAVKVTNISCRRQNTELYLELTLLTTNRPSEFLLKLPLSNSAQPLPIKVRIK